MLTSGIQIEPTGDPLPLVCQYCVTNPLILAILLVQLVILVCLLYILWERRHVRRILKGMSKLNKP